MYDCEVEVVVGSVKGVICTYLGSYCGIDVILMLVSFPLREEIKASLVLWTLDKGLIYLSFKKHLYQHFIKT